MTIYIGNDHGGYELKLKLLKRIEELGISYRDMGSDSTEIVRYPYYAAQVACAVSDGLCDRGILICSTGIGMSIIANKFPGVRAALCHTTYEARMTRQHNDSNILCMGGKTIGEYEALDILHTWLTESYIGGRHDISLNLIREAEHENFSDSMWNPTMPFES